MILNMSNLPRLVSAAEELHLDLLLVLMQQVHLHCNEYQL